MKVFLFLLTILSLSLASNDAHSQFARPALPNSVGITAELWNTRLQSGTSLSIDLERFGLDLAIHQEVLNDFRPHTTSLLAGHSCKTEQWLTFARAGVLYQWEQQRPGLTAETGLAWRVHDLFAVSFTLHGDLTSQGIIAGSRVGLKTHL
jgi:hypothetical protein